MKEEILNKLSEITDEERQLSTSSKKLKTKIYWGADNFQVEMSRVALSSEGSYNSPVLVRTHTRFVDFPAHSHDYIEMMYVCSGSITHVIADKEITTRSGDIILLGRNTKHSPKRADASDIGINIIVSIDFFEALINRMRLEELITDNPIDSLLLDDDSQYFIFHTSGVAGIENLLENIISSIVEEKKVMPYIIEREMELLLCYLCFMPEDLTEHSTVRVYSNEIKRIIANYIQTSYKNANLGDLSVLVGFTPTYMSRWIRKNMGTTFKDLLLEKRFEVASDLLVRTSMSVSDILNSVGYENSSYFHKQFMARYATTPRAYRKQAKKM